MGAYSWTDSVQSWCAHTSSHGSKQTLHPGTGRISTAVHCQGELHFSLMRYLLIALTTCLESLDSTMWAYVSSFSDQEQNFSFVSEPQEDFCWGLAVVTNLSIKHDNKLRGNYYMGTELYHQKKIAQCWAHSNSSINSQDSNRLHLWFQVCIPLNGGGFWVVL